MTTHGTTQRRKAQNKAKLAGYANEQGSLFAHTGNDKAQMIIKSGLTHKHLMLQRWICGSRSRRTPCEKTGGSVQLLDQQ